MTSLGVVAVVAGAAAVLLVSSVEEEEELAASPLSCRMSMREVVGMRAPGRGVAETEGGKEAGTAAKDTVGGSKVRFEALLVSGILLKEGVLTGVEVRS